MVTFKKDAALIRGEVHQRLGNTKLELLISRKGKKAKVNHWKSKIVTVYWTIECYFVCTGRPSAS